MSVEPNDLPFIVHGEWRDTEWFEARDKFDRGDPMTPMERMFLWQHPQPRRHPFGIEAFCRHAGNGALLIFENQESCDAWFARPRH